VNEFESLTWADMQKMVGDRIDFGSHTITHPILTKVSAEELEKEIYGSKKILEERLQKGVDSFCYPNGKRTDFNDVVKNKLRKGGYTCAVTAIDGFNDEGSDLFELRRISCNGKYFARNVNGVSYMSERVKNALNGERLK
jgi:peptidoglycan/xylan/chitin deacetylase (PgdA/CDA1 family)